MFSGQKGRSQADQGHLNSQALCSNHRGHAGADKQKTDAYPVHISAVALQCSAVDAQYVGCSRAIAAGALQREQDDTPLDVL